ncbi:MAG: threonine synthase [Cyanobacteriota bacterium]
MNNSVGFKCIECGAEFNLNETKYQCLKCNSNLQVVYDYEKIKKTWSKKELENNNDRSIWRYSPLYPVNSKVENPLIGGTPLYKVQKLGNNLGLKNLYLKDDGRNPSASFKDRASAMVLAKALDDNIDLVTGASTGNAASSMSCLSSSVGIKNIIFVPKTAPVAKITQLLVFGANVITVNGTYDQAFDLCLKATEKYGWYNRNTGYNPYTREGKKSAAFEIAEQFKWVVPDLVFVSVGDGNIISGIWKGFTDLYKIGFIDKLPRLVACQAEHSNSVQLAVDGDGQIREVSGCTVADSISVSVPRDGKAAVMAVKESNGFAVTVKDDEILNSIKDVARVTGVFGEPAGVTSYAGLKKAVEKNLVNSEEKILIMITGNGLKDVNSAMKIAGEPTQVEADEKELEKIYNKTCSCICKH